MLKKINTKVALSIIFLWGLATIAVRKVLYFIYLPYYKAVFERIKKGDTSTAAEKIAYATMGLNLLRIAAFHIVLIIMCIYLLFSRKKLWKELWLAYVIIIVCYISYSIICKLLFH